MKDFRITWIENVGYETLVKAKTKAEALKIFNNWEHNCESKELGSEIIEGSIKANCSHCKSEPCICEDKLNGLKKKK